MNGIERILVFFLFFCISFPYVSVVKTGFDSQPYAIFMSVVYLLYLAFTNAKVNYPSTFSLLIAYLFLAILIGIFDFFVLSDDFIVIARAIANYVSITILPIGVIIAIYRGFEYGNFLKCVIWMYFLSGLIQYAISPEVFDFLVLSRTTLSRGVTSLTPEPTYYGVVCYLLNLVILFDGKFNRKDKVFYSILLLFQTILLAKSSMALIFYIFLGFSYIVNRRNIIKGFCIAVSIVLGLLVIISFDFFQGTRINKILGFFIENGLYAFTMDASMNERLSHIYFSFYGYVENYFLPGGFSTFEAILDNKVQLSSGLFWYGGVSNKIMSFVGANIYEMGFLSMLYFFAIYKLVPKNNMKDFLICLFVPLFACIPLGNPLVALVFAVLYQEKRTNFEYSSGR